MAAADGVTACCTAAAKFHRKNTTRATAAAHTTATCFCVKRAGATISCFCARQGNTHTRRGVTQPCTPTVLYRLQCAECPLKPSCTCSQQTAASASPQAACFSYIKPTCLRHCLATGRLLLICWASVQHQCGCCQLARKNSNSSSALAASSALVKGPDLQESQRQSQHYIALPICSSLYIFWLASWH